MKQSDVPDLLIIAGICLLCAGVAAYDWRLALVVCGVLLLAIGFYGAFRR